MVTNFSNIAVDTTLNGAITNVATSLVVVSAAGYPVVPFNVQVENEVIRVGAKSGTTFSTLTRGYDGTTGVSHVDGSAVSHVVIAEDVGRTIQDWTPTLNSITIGNGTVVAKYQTIGEICWFYILITFGSTTTIAANPQFTIPVNAVRAADDTGWAYNSVGPVALTDNSANDKYSGSAGLNSDTGILLRYSLVASSKITEEQIDATTPFTWAVSDSIQVTGSYRIA